MYIFRRSKSDYRNTEKISRAWRGLSGKENVQLLQKPKLNSKHPCWVLKTIGNSNFSIPNTHLSPP